MHFLRRVMLLLKIAARLPLIVACMLDRRLAVSLRHSPQTRQAADLRRVAVRKKAMLLWLA